MNSMNVGGAETFMMKLYRNIDREKYQFDFCVGDSERGFYDDEIEKLGGRIHRIHSKSRNLKAFRKELYSVVKDNGYEYVLRVTANAAGLMDLKIAKKAGAKICGARSSNSSSGSSLKQKTAHIAGKILYLKYVDVAIAPSMKAAEYTFGRKRAGGGEVAILHNSVDMAAFRYSEEDRKRIRRQLGIGENDLLAGHIGRFEEQKNHSFLADVFKEIRAADSTAKLVLVGKGSLEEKFRAKAEENGTADRMIFTGVRTDVAALLCAMDVMVFPSLYEGMPNTVIEAQATGLPCVISDTITPEADITGLVEYVSLDKLPAQWAQLALDAAKKERKDTHADFVRRGYDIASSVEKFISVMKLDV